jgi:hypothetical protein
MGGERR